MWILVFSMLNLHFSVNYKAFQSALAFLIFYGILLYEHYLSQSSVLKRKFLMISQQNPRASILSNVF